MGARKIENAPTLFTFNDLVILPGRAEVEPGDVDLSTKVTLRHELKVPFVSSPMDTVTGAYLAIALARCGGLGVLPRNCSVEEQVEMARRVKRAESFIIREVHTIAPDVTVREAIELMESRGIHGLPVVDEGERLVGIVTWRDVRYADGELRVRDVMTRDLICAEENISLEDAKKLMQENKVEKLPVVDENMKLRGLVTIKDLELKGRYPHASRDDEGRLLVAAAVSPFDLERAKILDRYVDILVTDVAHFHNSNVIRATKRMMREISAELIVGNIGTYQAAVDVINELEEVNGFRVGIGSGSICSTSVVTKVSAPTLFATASVSDALRDLKADVPIIADGGVKSSGDIALALALGASAAMMGNIFAGCRESPGKLIALEGRYFKEYYGMGSHRAREKRYSLDRYSRPSKEIEEGVEGWVPYRGTVEDVVRELAAGLKAAMGYAGASNVREMWKKASVAFVSPAGVMELRPHDLITERKIF